MAIMRVLAAVLLVTACSPVEMPASTAAGVVGVHITGNDTTTDAAPGPGITGALGGINLPPTQGTSNAGAFMPGLSNWNYTPAQVSAATSTFNIVRLPINVASANDPATLATLQSIVDQFNGYAILCMFGTASSTTGTHGTGLIDDVPAAITAWQNIDAVFDAYPNVHYEILNEPFGYAKSDPATYVNTMTTIIAGANLPPSKCIIDGMGYADDIQLVANAGWDGDLGYHFYPNWSSDHTQSGYSNLVQGAIGSLGPRTWVTEFGANLGYASNNCYQTYEDGAQPSSPDINALRGLQDALGALHGRGEGVNGALVWHGWDNGDSYDFWNPANAQGACKVRLIETAD